MKFNKKMIVGIIIAITAILAVIFIGIYWHNHPTHYLYEDDWIIGKNASQIEQRYGAYDINSKTFYGTLIKGYCVKSQSTDYWWGDVSWPEYYMIHFDENGKAYKVEIEVGGWGG